jgi:hypothetical protein
MAAPEAPHRGGVGHDRPTWALWLVACNEEGHEAGAAEELGDKDNSVALCFGTVNQLQRAKAGNGSAWPTVLGSPSTSG